MVLITAMIRDAHQVTGYDIRKSHIKMANTINGLSNLSNLDFQVQDFFEIDQNSCKEADLVFFLGILYHLDNPLQAISKIRSLTKNWCVIETQVAKPNPELECCWGSAPNRKGQLLVLILFKDFRNQHYREFIEDIGDMDGFQEILDLSGVPHFTTLQKFFRRIKILYLRITFRKTVNLFYSSDENIPITAIDSFGLRADTAAIISQKEPVKSENISDDSDLQVITGFVASNCRVDDTRHAEKFHRQCYKTRKSDCYVMDKGYDSEEIHRLIRDDLHANSVIPIRSWNNDIIGGTYHREMAQQFNIYPRRKIVENRFSVLKESSTAISKLEDSAFRSKKSLNKMIVCNIHRFLLYFTVEVSTEQKLS